MTISVWFTGRNVLPLSLGRMNRFQVEAGKRMGQLGRKVTVMVANQSSGKGKCTKSCTRPVGIESLKWDNYSKKTPLFRSTSSEKCESSMWHDVCKGAVAVARWTVESCFLSFRDLQPPCVDQVHPLSHLSINLNSWNKLMILRCVTSPQTITAAILAVKAWKLIPH